MRVKLWRSQEEEWASNYYITRVKTGSHSVGQKILDWGTCPREAGPPCPRLSSPGERERNAVMANRVGVNTLQFCSVSNSLSHTTLSMKWEVYFSKELCRSSLLCRRYDYACIWIMWLCNIILQTLRLESSMSETAVRFNPFISLTEMRSFPTLTFYRFVKNIQLSKDTGRQRFSYWP